MKIGKFADVNNLSIDTIRHYMDFGLLFPEKQGGQYYFDERCQADLEEILSLKGLGFSLNEVKTIFMFRRLGKLTPYQQEEYYRGIFINKDRYLGEQIYELTEAKKKLEKKIEELSQREKGKKFDIGLDIRALDILCCASCGGELMLSKASINRNQVVEGELSCSCGESYRIEEGILRVSGENETTPSGLPGEEVGEYINETDSEYLDNIYKGMEWLVKRLDSTELINKNLLELGSGAGFFLRNAYDKLPESCLYIAVDHNIERHRFLKNMLERADFRRNVLFICSDFLKIPVKDRAIDVVLDISGTSNFSFNNEGFLLSLIDRQVKEKAQLFGSYILFKNFGANSRIEERYRRNFIFEHIKRNITSLGYKALDERTSDYLDKGGKYEDYFTKGEKVYSYILSAKR